MSKDLPKQTVAQAFVLWRVPVSMPISREALLSNLEQDIEDSADDHDFRFTDYSRRATPERTLKFLLQRSLLTERAGFISRNDRTKRYIARLPEAVVAFVDRLPICDPLTLLAGTSRKNDE
jgi:hypothetical protein